MVIDVVTDVITDMVIDMIIGHLIECGWFTVSSGFRSFRPADCPNAIGEPERCTVLEENCDSSLLGLSIRQVI